MLTITTADAKDLLPGDVIRIGGIGYTVARVRGAMRVDIVLDPGRLRRAWLRVLRFFTR